ncbi:MAG: type II toxin-antitoxin system HicB family antitoxin [Geminicoccaceae bacterium]
MRYAYPVVLDPEPDGSAINVAFPDVPGARTWGDDEAEALELAEDCLVTALYGYVRYDEPIPRPGPAMGRPMILVPPLVAARLALSTAMRKQGIGEAELARRLGVMQKVVQSILHLKRRTHIGRLERALAQLGVQLEVTVQEAA